MGKLKAGGRGRRRAGAARRRPPQAACVWGQLHRPPRTDGAAGRPYPPSRSERIRGEMASALLGATGTIEVGEILGRGAGEPAARHQSVQLTRSAHRAACSGRRRPTAIPHKCWGVRPWTRPPWQLSGDAFAGDRRRGDVPRGFAASKCSRQQGLWPRTGARPDTGCRTMFSHPNTVAWTQCPSASREDNHGRLKWTSSTCSTPRLSRRPSRTLLSVAS